MRLLALGDSYTVGTGLPEGARSFPQQLADRLGAELSVVAHNGWRTENLSIALDEAALAPPYDLVTLCIGVNDQYQGFRTQGYGERLHALLERAKELAGGQAGRVLLLTIPDYAQTPFGKGEAGVSEEIAGFNAVVKDVGADAGATVVDTAGVTDGTMVAEDGLHPSEEQYGWWAAAIQVDIT